MIFHVFLSFSNVDAVQFLEQLAVLLIDDGQQQVSALETFAAVSKSEMVYGFDNLGNKILLGVILSNTFQPSVIDDKTLEQDKASSFQFQDSPNDCWVAAIEECSTQKSKIVDSPEKVEPPEEVPIRIYRVNKGKKPVVKRRPKKEKHSQTLVELKKINIQAHSHARKKGSTKR